MDTYLRTDNGYLCTDHGYLEHGYLPMYVSLKERKVVEKVFDQNVVSPPWSRPPCEPLRAKNNFPSLAI
jgi:hypothetical protein